MADKLPRPDYVDEDGGARYWEERSVRKIAEQHAAGLRAENDALTVAAESHADEWHKLSVRNDGLIQELAAERGRNGVLSGLLREAQQALTPLANAYMPAEREALTEEDSTRAVAAIVRIDRALGSATDDLLTGESK